MYICKNFSTALQFRTSDLIKLICKISSSSMLKGEINLLITPGNGSARCILCPSVFCLDILHGCTWSSSWGPCRKLLPPTKGLDMRWHFVLRAPDDVVWWWPSPPQRRRAAGRKTTRRETKHRKGVKKTKWNNRIVIFFIRGDYKTIYSFSRVVISSLSFHRNGPMQINKRSLLF